MGAELKIIKIIKPGVDDYKFGEVIEVTEEYAYQLLKKGLVEEVSKKQLDKWQKYQLGLDLKAKAKKAQDERMKYVKLKLDSFMDNAEYFYNYNPFFYDDVGIFWFWDKNNYKYVQKDDIDLMLLFDSILGFEGQTVNSKIKANYLEAFKRVGRKYKPKDAPIKWIQFRDKAYSISSGMIYLVTPDYFFTNPIPYKFGKSTYTPIMDKLFGEWVGPENIDTLYEIIAYCCYRAYPMQLLFSLVGNGRNGKTCFLRLLSRFIGQDNICSTELDLLAGYNSSRFESFKLYKKLICLMGETNFGTLTKSSLIKKLTGGDLIGFEMKNKKPFDDYNYAKIIIASNSLPISDDTSEGFYRRWIIIDFPNQFKEGKDILETIPEHEYSNLALKVTQILPKLLKNSQFTNQGSINERTQKYILASNPISIFFQNCFDLSEDYFVSYSKLYMAYVTFLKRNKKRRVKRKEFKESLEEEGLWIERTSKKIDDDNWRSGNWVIGVDLKNGWEKLCILCSFTKNSHLIPYIGESSGKKLQNSIKSTENQSLPQEIEVEEVKDE